MENEHAFRHPDGRRGQNRRVCTPRNVEGITSVVTGDTPLIRIPKTKRAM